MISQLMQQPTSFLESAAQNIWNMINENLVFSKGKFRWTEMLSLCSKTFCYYDSNSNKYKFSNKSVNKRMLDDCGDGPMAKYRKVLDEFINVTSTNRGFRTVHRSVAIYEQTKKGLSYFYPKRIVNVDGIHTRPLNL